MLNDGADRVTYLKASLRDTQLDVKPVVEGMILDNRDRPCGVGDGAIQDGTGKDLSGSLGGGRRGRHCR